MQPWLRPKSYFWQEAPFFRLLLPLVAGIVGYDRWQLFAGQEQRLWLGLIIAVAAFTISTLIASHAAVIQGIRFLAFSAAIFLLGVGISFQNDARNNPQWYGRRVATTEGHLVRVTEIQERDRIWKVPVTVLQSLEKGKPVPASGKAYLNIYKNDATLPFKEGDTLLAGANWQPITNTNNPFGFDYATYCRRSNFFHQQFLGADEVQVWRTASGQDRSIVQIIHDGSLAQLRRYVKDSATLGLLEAMLVGYEGDFDPELRQAYSETGVVHIISISGSHVAMLILIVSWLFRLPVLRRWKWMQFLFSLTLIWLYVLVAGAPPSAVRSAVMFSVLALGLQLGKAHNSLNTTLAAAFGLLCYQPMWLFAVGFQLSFAAVLSLVLFYAPISRWWVSSYKPFRWLWQAMSASIAAQILTAPLVIFYFHNFPLWFIIANLFAWLIGGVGLVAGLFILATSWMPAVAHVVALVITAVVKAFHGIILFFQKGNPEALLRLYLDYRELILVYAVIGFGAIFFLQKRKPALFAGMASLLLLSLFFCGDAYQTLQQDRLVVYAVSRHDAVERIQGNHYQTVYSDTSLNNQRTQLEARIGYNAWKKSGDSTTDDLQLVHGKKVLLLKEGGKFIPNSYFPVDILIVTRSLKGLSLKELQSVFSPKLLVVGGSQKRWQATAWADSCAKASQAFHATALNGAYIVE